jgi:hypothetical protein
VTIRFQSQKIWTEPTPLSPLFSSHVLSFKSRSWLCNTRDRPLSLNVSFSLLSFAHPDLLTRYLSLFLTQSEFSTSLARSFFLSRWETRPSFSLLVGSVSLSFSSARSAQTPPLRHYLLPLRHKVTPDPTSPLSHDLPTAFSSEGEEWNSSLIIDASKTLVPLISATRRGQGAQRLPVRRWPCPFVVASCSNG